MTWDDGDGQSLNGNESYRLRLAISPPLSAFSSFTMYGLPDFYLVAKPINRYSIDGRTPPALKYAEDGSLTIVMQHAEPSDAEQRANCLPTPAGPFRPILHTT